MKLDRIAVGKPRCALVAAAVLGQGALGCAFAEDTPAAGVPAAAVRPAPVQAGGLTVAIDPATKQIRPPTPAEAASLVNAQALVGSVESQEIVIYRYPNGILSARLPESYMETAVATINPDGTLAFQCGRGLDTAPGNAKSLSAVSRPGTGKATQPVVSRGAVGRAPRTVPAPRRAEFPTPTACLEEK